MLLALFFSLEGSSNQSATLERILIAVVIEVSQVTASTQSRPHDDSPIVSTPNRDGEKLRRRIVQKQADVGAAHLVIARHNLCRTISSCAKGAFLDRAIEKAASAAYTREAEHCLKVQQPL
jgi:hypothetical protein